jgi:hypothetical protein
MSETDPLTTLRCPLCNSTEIEYRIAKAYCARCVALVINCCGD